MNEVRESRLKGEGEILSIGSGHAEVWMSRSRGGSHGLIDKGNWDTNEERRRNIYGKLFVRVPGPEVDRLSSSFTLSRQACSLA